MSYHNNPSARTPRQKSQPATIAELADKANADLDDHPAQGLKNWLRTAEKARKTGQYYKERGDLELAFVEFAKAATIVLDRIPRHPEYPTLLNGEQRHNLGNVRLRFRSCSCFVSSCAEALMGCIFRTGRIYSPN